MKYQIPPSLLIKAMTQAAGMTQQSAARLRMRGMFRFGGPRMHDRQGSRKDYDDFKNTASPDMMLPDDNPMLVMERTRKPGLGERPQEEEETDDGQQLE